MTISILIADDQAMVRAGFAAILEAQPDCGVVGQAENGAIAVELSQKLRPDIVLMDVRMPEMNGLEATKKLMELSARYQYRPRVIILTTFDIDEYVYDALAAGASGFLLKDAPPADLVQAVRVVAAGDALLAPSVTKRLINRFAEHRPPSDRHLLRLAELTEREREILVDVGKGLSNAEIADELFIAEQTVKTHITRIFSKLHLRDRVQAVILAYDAGLVKPKQ
ncbi:response regulator transcription factor [Lysinibacter sp. HNR]|uniref:response regulator n=1 Tax=Lysinibacter sp. HNR TaxID=3031408 RepID=UPI0024348D3D|nr:response regulator transcription factor [Lysinibacter sp. HNR]WGD36966.1 response regulator transcription factor [Lysinibacter sp. HNR]